MKRIHLVSLALASLTLVASVAGAQTSTLSVDRREWRQHQRIHQGWNSRELTRRERVRLRMGQRHVHRMEWRAKRDGHVGRFERRRLHHAQNLESRRIYRLKHNRRSRTL